MLSRFTDRNLVAGQILSEGCDIYSAYFSSDSVEMPPHAEFKELVEYCSEKTLKLPVESNPNAHYSVWGSSDVNPRRESFCAYLIARSLLVHNKGKAPTLIPRVGQEVLDLTICSIRVQRIIHDWRVSDQPSLSDNRYILYRIGTSQVL